MAKKKAFKKPTSYKLKLPDFDHTSEDMSDTLQEYSFQMGELARGFDRLSKARWKKEKSEARLYLILKDEIQDNGRPLSNDAVNASIIDDEDHQILVESFNQAKVKYEEQIGIVKQLEVKLEILRTVEATKRVELANHLN